MKVKVYGVIADCPAMSLILNHISHGGYYCCWFCKIEGKHVDKKRQYYYKKNYKIRDVSNFSSDSVTAQRLGTNIEGRLGVSILSDIVDIPLPKSIIADYLHVTLLRHAKTICLYIYKKVMKPKDRLILNEKMVAQRFPHFFQRTIRKLDQTGHK